MNTNIRRILVVDDDSSIHEDFRKLFAKDPCTPAVEAGGGEVLDYQLDFASQGKEGWEKVQTAIAQQKPYVMVFIDMQMPPGWDGVETMSRIWEIAPDLQVVLCTAYSDFELPDIIKKTGRSERFMLLKKPFNAIEVRQMANVFGEKWQLVKELNHRASKLEESQRQYRFLAEATPSLLWTATANGNIEYVNQRWQEYTGLTEGQSKDWGWQLALHPDDLAPCLERWMHALKTGEDFEIEYRLKRASDDVYRWFIGRAIPMCNQKGDIVHWVGTCTDIDDKKRAAEALGQAYENMEKRVVERTAELSLSEARYRELINGQGEGVVYTDVDLKFTFANPAAEQLLGLWAGQLVGKNFSEFLDAKNKAIVERHLRLRQVGKRTSYEVEVTDARGVPRQVLITASPQFNPDGRFCGTFAIFRDITQRKNAEIALRESQRSLRALLDNIPDPAWLKDAQGRYLVGNKPLAKIYQRTLEDIVGKTMGEVFTAHAGHANKGDAATKGLKQVRTEVCLPDSDGRKRWFDTIETPVFGENGQLAGTVGIARDITERRQIEEALRESENRYRELVDSQDDGVVVVDADQLVTFANPAAGKIFGLETTGLAGRNFREFVNDTQKKIIEEHLGYRKAGKKSSYELGITAANGEQRQILVNATPRMDADGHFCGTFAVLRDITERKRTEEKLRVQSSALAATANGIMITDPAGVIVWVNPAFTGLTGYGLDEVIGKTPAVLKSGVHSPDFYKGMWTTILEGKVWQGELANLRKDGSQYDEEMTITPVYDDHGVVKNFVAVKRDITQRKRDEEQLRVREQAFRALADNVPDAVIRLDRKLHFVYGNRAFCNALKLEPKDFLGKTGAELNLPQFLNWDKRIMEVFATGEAHVFEFTLPGPEGPLHHESRLVPERSAAGEVEFVLAMTRDVTVQKKAEVERQLMDLQLRQAQKMEAVGQLAAGIAHEINTPTQYVGDNTRFLKDAFGNISIALKGYMDLIAAAKQNSITPELIAQADEIVASSDLEYHFDQIPAAINETLEGVERVTKIVRAMKEFSHPGGREKNTADINKAIESTVTVARNEWKYVADMELDLDRSLPLVPCFISEFNQAVLNLVINAAHAIGDVVKELPGGKGKITVQTRREGDFAEVRVSDTGGGIAEQHRHRIFEPFFTTKQVGKGTGQGLTVVYSGIVKKHGGTVRFETEVGKGTTFILQLPIASSKPAEAPAAAKNELESVSL